MIKIYQTPAPLTSCHLSLRVIFTKKTNNNLYLELLNVFF